MRTSIGYHTITLCLRLTVEQYLELYETFALYDKVYFENQNPKKIIGYKNLYDYAKRIGLKPSMYSVIKYSPLYCNGITWILRYCQSSPSFITANLKKGEVDRPCSVKATINPKVLTDTDNYVLTSNELDLKKLIELFNQEAKRISPILRDFGSYSLNRIDYCINFDLDELRINSFPEVYMPFIRQGDIPYSYTEYSEYDDKSHRKKSDPDSFYLSNGSVDINCYDKHAQLRKKYKDNPNVNFDMARYLIRFEIQCKYSKIQYLQKPIKDIENFEEKVRILLSDEVCTNQVTKYYSKTIGKGDYFTLNAARNKIISQKYNRNRQERLIRDLEFVNQSRGIYKAKSLLTGHRLEDFKTSIKELGEIGINPATIPRETGIKFLPNLMRVYLEQKEKEEVAFL